MRFFNFFHAYMVQKYQNESAPIFYYGKSPKTNRKHLKIPYLQALTLGHVIKMTLYKRSYISFWEPHNNQIEACFRIPEQFFPGGMFKIPHLFPNLTCRRMIVWFWRNTERRSAAAGARNIGEINIKYNQIWLLQKWKHTKAIFHQN